MPTDISPYPMLPVDEAIRIILQHAAPLPVESVPRRDALGRILAEAIHASEDQPSFVASAVDGYALRSQDGRAPRTLRGDIRAGTSGAGISPGEARRIMTGAPVPPGADSVVMFEWAELRDGQVHPEEDPRPGNNMRPIGADMKAGDELIPAGARLGPTEIGLLAALGITSVKAHRLPTIAVLSTGDEVIDADANPSGPAIRDSNGPSLVSAMREAGYPAVFLGIARDTAGEQEALIRRGIEVADVLLTSGGVSVGSHDLIKPIFEKLGTLHFGRLNFKPGKPLTFATAGSKLLFGLPGNPVSALVCFALFIKPAIRRLAGETDVDPALVPAIAGETLRPSADRPDYQRAVARWEGGKLVVRTTGPQGSSRLRSLVGANALAIVPAGETPLPAGSPLDAILLGPVSGDRTLGFPG